MQVSVETTQGLERKMTVAVPSEKVDSAVNTRLQEAARNVKLNGFRKGKVPYKVIKSKFGAGVRQEVVGELMNQSYYEAIDQESLKPAGQPNIAPKNLDEGQDLEFVATFQVYPEITLPDFSTIKAERLGAEISETDIDEMIETLRKQRQSWEVSERAAATEDMVNIDYVGRRDGEDFEGGSAQGTNLVLGSERMIPGFESGIEGKSAGDAFTLDLSFPEEYHNTELAGKEVAFEITLNSVSEQVMPAIDEEFYKSFGVEEGGNDAFREEVTNNMRRELKTASRNKLKNKIMDSLVDAVDAEVPDALVSGEIEQLRQQAMQQFGGGQKIDANMLPDDLFKEQAVRRVLLGLVLGEVIQQQELKADPTKVRESIEELASTYESPDEVINWYYGNQEQLATIESGVLEDQVFDYVIDQSAVTDKLVGYQEVIQPDPKAAGEQSGEDAESDA
ncbi:MAG: trigger factor [SAR86 cluster bacterium]|uniref:Trigger factor n=1 Tax=SAR86 cluster bacterium TaxID=2030880 RepID=A0A2A4WTE5_9GAMM|nr:MAG: trigger factor [SAR86 cluster bacterium]